MSGRLQSTETHLPSQASATEPAPDLFACFQYLTVEKAALYRAVIDVFTEAKAEFRLHLRPGDVAVRLRDGGQWLPDEVEVEAALESLVAWGNLQAYHDTAEVSTLADFHRRRMLYQLTAAGEAADRAAHEFLAALDRPVALEAAALGRIAENLGELLQLAREPEPDAGKVLTVLRAVSTDAEQLTLHAQSFFRWLHEQTAALGANLDAFLQYKERLIDYLRRFLAELAERAGVIAGRLEELEPRAEKLLAIVAALETEAVFARDEEYRLAKLAMSQRKWLQRWRGLRHWFIGVGGSPQVTQLRYAAGGAIPRLLALAAQLHDRRATRSDRRADWIALAAWFAEAVDDRQAHLLWRAAFGLSPARHLRVDEARLAAEEQRRTAAATSWLDAPPVEISPQLRQTGRLPAAAPTRRIIDRHVERAELLRRIREEREQLSRARQSLIDLGLRNLADVGCLELEALLQLVELLDRASAVREKGLERASASSDDGILSITIDWNVPQRVATIETSAGFLHGHDASFRVDWSGRT